MPPCGGCGSNSGARKYLVKKADNTTLGPFATNGEALIVQGQNPGSSIIEVSQ